MNRNWIVNFKPRASSSLRLFCFPYSGAGPHIYYPWLNEVPQEIEITAVQLPGHGARIHEKPWDDFQTLVSSLCQALLPHLSKPFSFFGHSLGALLCFEVARELRRSGQPGPLNIFAAGRQAPHIKNKLASTRDLGRNEFIEVLRLFQGTPEVVLQSEEMLDLFLPVIRADFLLNESYVYTEEAPLECAISSFGGLDDEWVGHDEVSAWEAHTAGPFKARLLPGRHFFNHSSQSLLIQAVCGDFLTAPNLVAVTPDREAFDAG